jgi:hypothetical protein
MDGCNKASSSAAFGLVGEVRGRTRTMQNGDFGEPPLLRGCANRTTHGRQEGKASYTGSSASLVRPDPSEFMT